MTILFANNASSTLASAVSAGATTITLVTGGGTAFPSPTGSNYFIATIISAANPNVLEIVNVTARTGDSMTVVRGQEGTTALSWNPDDIFELRITAGGLAGFVTGSYVISFNSRSGAVSPASGDYATWYPQLTANNSYIGSNTFRAVTVSNGYQFQSGNIVDAGTTGAGVHLYYAQSQLNAKTISGGFQVNGDLVVTGTGNFNTSSLQFKEDVKPLKFDSGKFLKLQAISYKNKSTQKNASGFSAEQMYEICPELVMLKDGKPYAINYQGTIPYLLEVIKELRDEIRALSPRLN